MSAERGTWLMASEVTGRTVRTTDPYPHVHQDRRCGRKGCAACGGAADPDGSGPVRHGIGGHDCRPAGRGTQGRNWACPECGADWIVISTTKAGVRNRTWERA